MSSTNSTSSTPSTTTDSPEPEEYPVWVFILVECLYIIIFVVIMSVIHKIGVLKNDDDAVTIHHKIHGEMIENQEKKFVEEQMGDFATR